MQASTNLFQKAALSAALISALAAPALQAASETNNMTNIVTVADACDIVAIGVDFGITTAPIPTSGVTSVTPNTTAGNALTGNAAHPKAARDGGAGNDDELALTGPLSAVTNPLLTGVVGALPGVYVACTVTPTAITVTSSAAGSAPYSLPRTVGGTPTGTFAGKMGGDGGGAAAANLVNYTLSFTGTPVSVVAGPVSLFIAAFTATGTIPAAQPGTVVPGYYTDVAVAQVDF